MSKKDDLKLIDDLYRKFLIGVLNSGELDIKDASQIVQYLKANEMTSERERSSQEDEVKKRLEEAKKRRA